MLAARLATLEHGQKKADVPIETSATQADAAALLNVSKHSVQRACVVLDTGSEELIEVVDEGLVAVSQAVKMAKAPVKTQRKVVKKIRLV